MALPSLEGRFFPSSNESSACGNSFPRSRDIDWTFYPEGLGPAGKSRGNTMIEWLFVSPAPYSPFLGST